MRFAQTHLGARQMFLDPGLLPSIVRHPKSEKAIPPPTQERQL